jgi:hypothetical protein
LARLAKVAAGLLEPLSPQADNHNFDAERTSQFHQTNILTTINHALGQVNTRNTTIPQ